MMRTLSFSRSRSMAAALWQRRSIRVAIWYLLSLIAIGPYALLRGKADDFGMPVHGAGLEATLFGGLPTVWLQYHVYSLAPNTLEAAAVAVHMSWFFIPLLASFLVAWKRPDRIGSFFRWWMLLEATALILFAAVPMRPPWMADPDVIRIIALRHGGEIYDNNPVAAMPSLHVAFPMLLAFWFRRERWQWPASAMAAYAALIGVEVVFSGEHYVVDVLGAVVFATVLARVASFGWLELLHNLWARIRKPAPVHAEPVPVPAAAWWRSERAQTLIEAAFVLPIVLLFFFSLVDFGIAIDKRIALQHGVREGARYAAVHTVENDIKQRTVDESEGIVDLADVDVCYEDGSDSNSTIGDAGDSVRVASNYTWDFPIMSELLGVFGVSTPSIDLTPSASARLERSVSGAAACPP